MLTDEQIKALLPQGPLSSGGPPGPVYSDTPKTKVPSYASRILAEYRRRKRRDPVDTDVPEESNNPGVPDFTALVSQNPPLRDRHQTLQDWWDEFYAGTYGPWPYPDRDPGAGVTGDDWDPPGDPSDGTLDPSERDDLGDGDDAGDNGDGTGAVTDENAAAAAEEIMDAIEAAGAEGVDMETINGILESKGVKLAVVLAIPGIAAAVVGALSKARTRAGGLLPTDPDDPDAPRRPEEDDTGGGGAQKTLDTILDIVNGVLDALGGGDSTPSIVNNPVNNNVNNNNPVATVGDTNVGGQTVNLGDTNVGGPTVNVGAPVVNVDLGDLAGGLAKIVTSNTELVTGFMGFTSEQIIKQTTALGAILDTIGKLSGAITNIRQFGQTDAERLANAFPGTTPWERLGNQVPQRSTENTASQQATQVGNSMLDRQNKVRLAGIAADQAILTEYVKANPDPEHLKAALDLLHASVGGKSLGLDAADYLPTDPALYTGAIDARTRIAVSQQQAENLAMDTTLKQSQVFESQARERNLDAQTLTEYARRGLVRKQTLEAVARTGHYDELVKEIEAKYPVYESQVDQAKAYIRFLAADANARERQAAAAWLQAEAASAQAGTSRLAYQLNKDRHTMADGKTYPDAASMLIQASDALKGKYGKDVENMVQGALGVLLAKGALEMLFRGVTAFRTGAPITAVGRVQEAGKRAIEQDAGRRAVGTARANRRGGVPGAPGGSFRRWQNRNKTPR